MSDSWGRLGPEALGSGGTDPATISAPRAAAGTRAAGRFTSPPPLPPVRPPCTAARLAI